MKFGWVKLLLPTFWNTVVCAIIAQVVLEIALAPSYAVSIKVSLSIGYSIQLTFFVFDRFLYPGSTSYWVGLSKGCIGLLLGMCLGSLLMFDSILFLFYYPAGREVLLFSVIVAVFAGVFTITKVRMASQGEQISQLEAKQFKQEAIALENEIELLQDQIEPHFLFNTLSNIVSLIEIKPKLAEKSLVNLTQLLRVKLDRGRDKIHTLGDELWLLNAYLELHKMRLGERLTYQFLPTNIKDDVSFTSLAIPSLLVQPLVENAIQHGIEPSVKGGNVSIELAFSDNRLVIKVTDTGLGFKAPKSANLTNHSGIGLSNVRRRLHAIYADRATLSILDNEPSGAILVVTLPMEAC